MGRGFSATWGIGESDKVQTTLTTDVTVRSWFCRALIHGYGGSNNGMMWRQGPLAGPSVSFYTTTSYSGKLQFFRSWNGNDGIWYVDMPSWDVFHSFGLVYDKSSTANAPIFYVDATKPTVTNPVPPTGTAADSLSGTPFCVGCISNSTIYSFDGIVSDMATWDVALTDNEFLALNAGVRPYNIRPASLAGYWPLDGIASPEPDLSGLARNGTVTGTVQRSSGGATFFTPRWPNNRGEPLFVVSEKHFRFRIDAAAVDAEPTWGAAEDVGQ